MKKTNEMLFDEDKPQHAYEPTPRQPDPWERFLRAQTKHLLRINRRFSRLAARFSDEIRRLRDETGAIRNRSKRLSEEVELLTSQNSRLNASLARCRILPIISEAIQFKTNFGQTCHT